MKRSADEIMERGGFPPTETGPYVTALRKQTRELVEKHGLADRSPGTWGAGPIDTESRAKALLASQWRMDHGHCCRIECIGGPPWGWTWVPTTFASMERRYEIRWRMIGPWLGDLCRRVGMRYRVWRDRNLENPYE